jgi:hypothetical protein
MLGAKNRIQKLCSEQKIEFENYAQSKKSNSKIMLFAFLTNRKLCFDHFNQNSIK